MIIHWTIFLTQNVLVDSCLYVARGKWLLSYSFFAIVDLLKKACKMVEAEDGYGKRALFLPMGRCLLFPHAHSSDK